MSLAWPRRMLREYLLARKCTISIPAPVAIASHIAICVPHIVPVFFVKLIVGDFGEPGAPEHEAFFEVEPDAFEEERVLKAAVVLEMCVATQGPVQILHAKREGGGERIDVSC